MFGIGTVITRPTQPTTDHPTNNSHYHWLLVIQLFLLYRILFV